MAAHVQLVEDIGGDHVRVTGTVDGNNGPNGKPATVVVLGWLSATTNHYGPECYDQAGALKAKSTPRAMTTDEAMAYYAQLLTDNVPVSPAPKVLYKGA